MTLPAQDIVERLRAWAGNYEEGSFDTEESLMTEAADTISRLTADNEALAQALRGALADQVDLLYTCRKYAEEARDDDTRRVRHIRADRIEERVNATRAALANEEAGQ